MLGITFAMTAGFWLSYDGPTLVRAIGVVVIWILLAKLDDEMGMPAICEQEVTDDGVLVWSRRSLDTATTRRIEDYLLKRHPHLAVHPDPRSLRRARIALVPPHSLSEVHRHDR